MISTVNSMFISSYPNIFNYMRKWIFFILLFLLLVFLKWDSLSNYIFLLFHILAACINTLWQISFFWISTFHGISIHLLANFHSNIFVTLVDPNTVYNSKCFVSLIFKFFFDSFLFYFSLTPWQWRADRQGLWC